MLMQQKLLYFAAPQSDGLLPVSYDHLQPMPSLPDGSLNAPQLFIGLLRIHLPDGAVSVIGAKQDQAIAIATLFVV